MAEEEQGSFDPEDVELPDFLSEEEERLFSVAQLGVRAEQFRNSQVGRHLRECLNREIQDCAYKLLDVDPDHPKEIEAHQKRADAARLAWSLILETINQGEAAHQQLIQHRE